MRISDWSSDVCSSDLPNRIPMVYSPSFRPCAAEAGTRRHRLTPGCSCAFTKTRDWSRQMQTVEHLVALEQPQKTRQKHGTQDKRGRHSRARRAFHGKALWRQRWHPGSAADMSTLLACKALKQAVRAG